MIIAFAGTKGSGKSTACDVLAKHGYHVINFADPLKMMAVELTGVPLHECYDLEAKERRRNFLITSEEFINLLKRNNLHTVPKRIQETDGIVFDSLRQVLQFIGTELFREVSKDFWIKDLVSKIHPSNNYCIGDSRFQNELDIIKQMKGITVKIIRPSVKFTDLHASENADILKTDITIVNEDLQQFEKDVLKLIEYENLHKM